MLDQRKHAIQIHRDGTMPLFVGHAIDGRILRRPDAVIRNQNVEPPERRDRSRYQLLRRLRGREIALRRATVSLATCTHQILGLRLRRLIVEDNFRARRHKHPHRRRTNAARSAGNKSNFRIKSQIHKRIQVSHAKCRKSSAPRPGLGESRLSVLKCEPRSKKGFSPYRIHISAFKSLRALSSSASQYLQPLPPLSNPSAAPETSNQTSSHRRFPSFLVSMVLAALAIRLVVMVFLLPEQLDPQRDHWHFGYEAGRIARSIVQGRGFSSPLFEDTGPTAWMTPVYPFLVAGVFKLFGIYTKASAIVLLSLNALMSALVCILAFLIARFSFGDRVAKWSGWAWAFWPYAIYFPVERIWETWLATLLLCVLFLITLNLGNEEEHNHRGSRGGSWILFGVLWGVAALTSPAL